MIKVLIPSLENITHEDYKYYCQKNSLNYDSMKPYFFTWAIQEKELMLAKLTDKIGNTEEALVTGLIQLNSGTHVVAAKILKISNAFSATITPDVYDWEICWDDKQQQYIVYGYHDGSKMNIFRLKIL